MIKNAIRHAVPFAIGLTFAGALAACSGAGRTPSTTLPSINSQTVDVAFSIAVPKAVALSPEYISPSTLSAVITVTPTGAPAFPNIIASCPQRDGKCTATVKAAFGVNTFTVALYDQANGTGNILSQGSATQNITAYQSNTVNLAFDGIIASLSISLQRPVVLSGTPATIPVIVNVHDAAEQTIIGTQPYTVPIRLSNSDSSGSTGLSVSTLTAPGQPVNLSYNGSAAFSSAIVSASVAGLTTSAATGGLLTRLQPGSGAIDHIYSAAFNELAIFNAHTNGVQQAPYFPAFNNLVSGHQVSDFAFFEDANGNLYYDYSNQGNTASAYAGSFKYNPASGVQVGYLPGDILAIDTARNVLYVCGDQATSGYAAAGFGKCGDNLRGGLIYAYDLSATGATATSQFAAQRLVDGDATSIDGNFVGYVMPDGSLAIGVNSRSSVIAEKIVFYAATANGNVSPIRSISGNLTGLNGISAMTSDASGNLYVLNGFDRNIEVFGRTAAGNTAPIRAISNPPASCCYYARQIYVDNSGSIYVYPWNDASPFAAVAEFDPSVSGYTAVPSRLTKPIATPSGGIGEGFNVLTMGL